MVILQFSVDSSAPKTSGFDSRFGHPLQRILVSLHFGRMVGNPEGILLKLALMRVTTRIVLREKKLRSFASWPSKPRAERSQRPLSLIANRLQGALTRTSTTTPSIASL